MLFSLQSDSSENYATECRLFLHGTLQQNICNCFDNANQRRLKILPNFYPIHGALFRTKRDLKSYVGLDLMILEVFSSLNDCMIVSTIWLWQYDPPKG